jgi:WD40 repeat protein
MRAHEAPLEELTGHSHWVWCARFNPVYDQLIISGSSDATVR